MTKTAIVTLGLLLATTFGAQSALAFGGGEHKGPRGDREGLVPQEMKAEWREAKKAEFENLTDEERQALREEMRENKQTAREERRAAFEEFTGLSGEELKEAKQSGESIGNLLSAQGITEGDAENFLTEQATNKVDSITERHDIDAEDEQTLRDRISTFVQSILDRWFGEN